MHSEALPFQGSFPTPTSQSACVTTCFQSDSRLHSIVINYSIFGFNDTIRLNKHFILQELFLWWSSFFKKKLCVIKNNFIHKPRRIVSFLNFFNLKVFFLLTIYSGCNFPSQLLPDPPYFPIHSNQTIIFLILDDSSNCTIIDTETTLAKVEQLLCEHSILSSALDMRWMLIFLTFCTGVKES